MCRWYTAVKPPSSGRYLQLAIVVGYVTPSWIHFSNPVASPAMTLIISFSISEFARFSVAFNCKHVSISPQSVVI